MSAPYEIKLNGNVFRRSDGAWIPQDPANADYQLYVTWSGNPANVADVEPPPEPPE